MAEPQEIESARAPSGPLTREKVHAAASRLYATLGRRPSVREVMAELGTRTTPTVHRHLKTWSETGAAPSAAGAPSPALDLWTAALATARQEVQAERAQLAEERASFASEREALVDETRKSRRDLEERSREVAALEAAKKHFQKLLQQALDNNSVQAAQHDRAVQRFEQQLADQAEDLKAARAQGKSLEAERRALQQECARLGKLVEQQAKAERETVTKVIARFDRAVQELAGKAAESAGAAAAGPLGQIRELLDAAVPRFEETAAQSDRRVLAAVEGLARRQRRLEAILPELKARGSAAVRGRSSARQRR